ncbi:Sugar transporter [Acidilobus saccharovorans 345-15]|uniref:Sugar transporter n=1 Tax=Acidilobus saccharovorans (strain DSM 16705 / JCM 18335 / VKM B-2471 / 345-15) TaxID=666510 RepID=D9PZ37_ACIS3|nr:hypothetical protein [Acidilobus saccharovorans]ADL19824.1 Sugar transporter [Acidilobus saccharovorans 345-15]
MEELARRLDSSRWTSAHGLIFTSTSLGMFIWGLEAMIGPAGYFAFHRSLAFLIAFYAFDFIGDIAIGRLSDTTLARKGAFYVTMSLIGVGLLVLGLDLVITAGRGLIAVLAGLAGAAVMKIGIEGDVPVSLAFLAENTPAKYRNRVLVLSPNFNNIGGAVGAAVLYLTYTSTNSYLYAALALLVATAVALAVTFAVRATMPESVRWLMTKGMSDRASREASALVSQPSEQVSSVSPTVGIGGRYAFLALLGLSQYLTFGLMAFTIAYFYYSGATVYFIQLVALLGASIAGVPAAFLPDIMDTRNFTLLAYVGGFLSMIPIALALRYLGSQGFLSLFYPLLFLNMVFSELAWAVRTIYEPVLFPTHIRATMIGLVRAVPIASYDVSLYVTSSWSEWQFVLFNIALWGVGAATSVLWRLRGYDTRRALLESVSSPRPAAPL